MTKYILYIILLISPLSVTPQAESDTIAVAETVVVPEGSVPYQQRTFSEDFKEDYTGEDFEYEEKTQAKSQWDRFMEWLRNLIDRIFNFGSSANNSDGYTIFLRILAFAVIGFAIYLIARVILNKESGWIFGKSGRSIVVENVLEENLTETDFRKLVDETTNAGNYRLAIRYYYLWVLKKLALREIIDWHYEKTNNDYLYEIKNPALRKDFEYLSYVYDYAWYGEFHIDQQAFAKAEKAFRKTLNTL